jgi:hypothetical protein
MAAHNMKRKELCGGGTHLEEKEGHIIIEGRTRVAAALGIVELKEEQGDGGDAGYRRPHLKFQGPLRLGREGMWPGLPQQQICPPPPYRGPKHV